MQDDFFALMMAGQEKQELTRVLSCNEDTAQFGLTLTAEEGQMLMKCRRDTLKEQRRVEMGEGILPKLILAFCDSSFIEGDDYAELLAQLQEVFYLFKNESMDLVSDEELLEFMREQFDEVCYGSVDYLEETCLERFSRAVRAGYDGYKKNGAKGEYTQFSEEVRWERELYWKAMSELFG